MEPKALYSLCCVCSADYNPPQQYEPSLTALQVFGHKYLYCVLAGLNIPPTLSLFGYPLGSDLDTPINCIFTGNTVWLFAFWG
jgi:hypothetical protein